MMGRVVTTARPFVVESTMTSPLPTPGPNDEPWWSRFAKLEIAEVIRRRASAADRRDVELARTCYHPGATEDHGGFVGPVDDYLAWSPISDEGPRTGMWHCVSTPLIEVDGTEASAETYVFTVETVGETGPIGRADMQVGGRYLDHFEHRDGRWAIAARQLVWDWTRAEPGTAPYWEIMGLPADKLPMGHGGPADGFYGLRPPLDQR